MPGEGVTVDRTALIRKLFGPSFRISRWWFGGASGHDGIDLPARTGTPIRALSSGRVSYARDARTDPNAGRAWAIGAGKVVNIDIDSRYTTQYAHMQDIFVKPGQYVKAGTIIGTVGSTGGLPNSPGANFGASSAHLHFGLWDHKLNKHIMPDAYLQAVARGDTWGEGSDVLGAWGDHVKYPTGHILTQKDVYDIVEKLQDIGMFDGQGPLAGAIGRQIVTGILLRHVGEPWNKDLQATLQAEFNQGATEATALGGAGNPLNVIAQPVMAIGDLATKAADPANWVRIFAILAGAGLVAIGGIGVLRSTGTAPSVSIPRPGANVA